MMRGPALGAMRTRFADERGFTMLLAIGVLAVTALLLSAVWIAVQGDAHQSQHDLDAKRAYFAASAGVNAYLYQLNQNPNYWETCTNDTQGLRSVPGSSTGEQYAFAPIVANGYSSCDSTNVIGSMVDSASGSLRLKFTGYSGGSPQVSRTIVAQFRENSPFDFLWYTVYEALDATISGYSSCNAFYRANTRPSGCNIYWVGDTINGPMYTQDQYLIAPGYSPTFGRSAADKIESAAPGSSPANICSGNNCASANIKGTAVPGAPTISPPSSNAFLQTDATNYGKVFTGTTSITLSGTSATVSNCPSSCTTTTVDLKANPIIYVQNGSGCSPAAYTPYFIPSGPRPGYGSYPGSPPTGCAGDVYVSGTYTTPLTIGAADDVIIDGNVQTTEDGSGVPTGTATLGLVANQFVRILHGVNYYSSNCDNYANQSTSNLKIDAVLFAIQHSFILDNYECGASLGTLTVHGVIAQYYRGAVGTFSGSTSTGYIKNYNYDDRLKYLLPPYLFNVSNSGWHLGRETLCVPGGTDPSTAC